MGSLFIYANSKIQYTPQVFTMVFPDDIIWLLFVIMSNDEQSFCSQHTNELVVMTCVMSVYPVT